MKTIHKIIAIVCVIVITGCSGGGSDNVLFNRAKDQDPDQVALIHQAQKDVEAGTAILLDVRSQKEWDGGHFEHAIHVPVDQITNLSDDASEVKGVDKSKKIYTHCAKGVRATNAAEKMEQLGYDVVPLQVTFKKINEEGFELAK